MTRPPDAATFFGARASAYDERYDAEGVDGYALRARLATVLALAGEGPGSALDAGMGPGRLCAELAARGWTVSGVDAAEEMVAAARARLSEAAPRLQLGQIEALPFADESFDLVAATGVLEYADVPRALAELARVLRPGGLAVVSYPNPSALYGIWKSRVWYRMIRGTKRVLGLRAEFPRGGVAIPRDRFEGLLRSAGLSTLRADATSYLVLPTPLDLLAPRLATLVAGWLEGGGPRRSRLLATQVVYAARKSELRRQ